MPSPLSTKSLLQFLIKIQFFILLMILMCSARAGAEHSIRYSGRMLSGELVELSLSHQDGEVSGILRDSSYAYQVTGEIRQQHLNAYADQATLGLRLNLNGEFRGSEIDLEIRFSLLGEESSERIYMTRIDQQHDHAASIARAPRSGNKTEALPTNANRDSALIGHWTHESIYNSGVGADFFGSTTRQELILLADGRVANGGSDVSVSGDFYSGNSSDASSAVAAGVTWFTRDQHLWLQNTNDAQSVDLGRYYAEAQRMMITGNNGKRMLFVRAR